MIGQVFGRLIVKGFSCKNGRKVCECLCRCGRMVSVSANNINSGNTQSCGCRKRVFLIWNGKRQCIKDWAKELGFPKYLISRRIRKGWSVDETLGTPKEQGTRRSK